MNHTYLIYFSLTLTQPNLAASLIWKPFLIPFGYFYDVAKIRKTKKEIKPGSTLEYRIDITRSDTDDAFVERKRSNYS